MLNWEEDAFFAFHKISFLQIDGITRGLVAPEAGKWKALAEGHGTYHKTYHDSIDEAKAVLAASVRLS